MSTSPRDEAQAALVRIRELEQMLAGMWFPTPTGPVTLLEVNRRGLDAMRLSVEDWARWREAQPRTRSSRLR